jgi:hypothetical protein
MKFASAAVVVLTAVGTCAFLPSASIGRRVTFLEMGNAILPKVTGRSSLDPAVTDRYNALPFPDDKILAEYVWVDADGNCRSKTRTLPKKKVLYSHSVFLSALVYIPCISLSLTHSIRSLIIYIL